MPVNLAGLLPHLIGESSNATPPNHLIQSLKNLERVFRRQFVKANNQFEATFRCLLHRTIDGVVDGSYKVSRNHPFLNLDWSRLREEVNSRVELFDSRSPYVQSLMHSLRSLNLDLADLSPPLLLLADRANSSRELVTQLRLLRSTLEVKLDQFERSRPRNLEGGRRFR